MKLNQELFAVVNQDNEIECDYDGPYISEDREYLDGLVCQEWKIVKIKIVPIDNP